MAWTAPRTWVTAEVVTAALMNTHVRDNLLETAAAKVTTAGDLTYATAANTLTRLAVGTNQQFLVGTASAPVWSNTLGSSASSGLFILRGPVPAVRWVDQGSADPGNDYWQFQGFNDGFKLLYNDDSVGTFDALQIAGKDFILHTGAFGTGEGSVIIDTDTETGPTALTTAGNTILSVPSFNTGGPAYVEGFWMLTVERTSAASVSSLDMLPRDDGVNLSTRFAIADPNGVSQGDMIPAAADEHTFGGMFWLRHTASNTSTYSIFVVAGDNSRFQVNSGHLYVRSIQYPT